MQNDLGVAYEHVRQGERVDNITRAIRRYRAALEVYEPDRFPVDARRTAGNLARAYTATGNEEHAYD